MTPGGPAELVFTVHVTKPDEVGAVEIVFRSERDACSYAKDRSRDFRVTSASVTRFVVAELGTRHPVAWFQDGEEQHQRFHGPERQFYPTACHTSDQRHLRPAGSDESAVRPVTPA